jgi:hypothetical protein
MPEIDKYPTRYRIEYIEPGLMNYDDVGQGTVFVSREALDRMHASYVGKPVINKLHKELRPEEAFKLSDEEKQSLADGVIYNYGWLDNGRCYADCIIWDLETKKNIKNGYSASCAYMPTKVNPNGVWHGIPYDEEVVDGVYTHMAIVKKPRYEFAKIYELSSNFHNSISNEVIKIYQNSKEEHLMAKKKIFSFFKNNAMEDIVEEEKVNMDGAMVEIDGQQVPLSEVIAAYKEEKSEEAQGLEVQESQNNVINPEDEIDIDGEKVLASKLIEAYQKRASMANAEDPTDTPAEEVVDEAKQKENVKKNAHFNSLDNAVKNTFDGFKLIVESKDERVKRGNEKYGSGGKK